MPCYHMEAVRGAKRPVGCGDSSWPSCVRPDRCPRSEGGQHHFL